MKQNRFFHFIALAVVLLAGQVSAFAASTFTVTNSGNVFTIIRSGDTDVAETVDWRVVSLSAIAGQHFTGDSGGNYSGTLTFTAGQTSKTVTITESTPGTDAYKYQTGTERKYRFEVLDRDGYILAASDRTMTTGSNVTSTAFNEKSATIQSAEFTVTDGGYTQGYKSVASTSFYNAATKNYLSFVGAQLRMTLDFQAKEVNDGYQYVQILADNATSKDGKDPDGGVNTPSTSIYKACFELSKGSGSYPGTVTTDHYQAFPHRTNNHTSSTEFDYADAYLYAQAFQDQIGRAHV